MKVFLLIIGCLLASVTLAEDEGIDFKGEFFQGMETGFFLRENPEGHKEYECADPNTSQEVLKKINSVLGPVQMLL